MNKLFLSLALLLLSFGSVAAAPRFKELNNKHGKTTIIIEIPASDRDETNGLSVDNVKLYNNGETLTAKKVNAMWGETPLLSWSLGNSRHLLIAPLVLQLTESLSALTSRVN